MEITQSNKGKRKIISEGYQYNDERQLKDGHLRFRCSQRGKKTLNPCLGSITTDSAITAIIASVVHNHGPDPQKAQAQILRAEMKGIAESTRIRPKTIMSGVLSKHMDDKDACIAAGNKDALRQMITRTKKVKRPKNPTSIEDIPVPLPREYSEYIIYDNEESKNRILIFASSDGLEVLGSAEKWFMDGTFFTCPSQFEQLYIIRVPLGDSCVTAAYALLPSKTKEVYIEMLNGLRSVCGNRDIVLDPVDVIADFEIGLHNAVTHVFNNETNIIGCFYHLTQSTFRRVQSEGFQTLYNVDKDFRNFCGKIDGLAFLPVSDVKDGLKVLYEEVPDNLRCLLEYFDATYVNGGFKVQRPKNYPSTRFRLRRIPPLFPPPVWNVHLATLQGGNRTNNYCESFNRNFKQLVGCANPSLWLVIECIMEDICMASIDRVRESKGVLKKKRVKKGTLINQHNLKRLCNEYNNKQKNLQQFLNSIGKKIRIAKPKKKTQF